MVLLNWPLRFRGRLKQGFVGNLIVMVSGTALAQAVTVAVSPILTRLYSPSDFGVLAIYSALLSILLVVSSLRYELAIPLPKDDETARSLAIVSLLILLMVSIVVGALVPFAATLTPLLGMTPVSSRYLWIVPLGLLGAGTYQILSYWAVRRKEFGALVKTKLSQNVGMALIQSGLPLLQFGAFGLIVGDVAGRMLGVGTLFKRISGMPKVIPEWNQLWKTSLEYKEFPTTMLLAALLNIVSLQIPLLLLPRLFGLGSVGRFFIAYRILTLPISMVAMAVSQVFFSEISTSKDEGHTKMITLGLAMLIFALGFPVYVGLIIVGPSSFSFVFGEAWFDAGIYAQLLAPMLLFRLVANCLSSLLTVGRRFREALFFTVAELIAVLVALWLGAVWNSMMVFVSIFAILSIPLNIASLWRFTRVARVQLRDLSTSAFIPIVLVNLPGLCFVALVASIAPSGLTFGVWALTSAGAMIYCMRLPRLKALLANR
jgi:O-antigen/teichoic acid export membrane protein